MNLQQRLDTIRKGSVNRIGAEDRAVMHRCTEQLRDSGIMDGIKKDGDTAPGFALPDSTGTTVRSDDVLQSGPFVLSFFRGFW